MAWLGTWKKRKKLIIDHTKIDADLTHFPVTVIIDGDTDFFGELSADTDKLKVAFTKDDGITQLYFECEYFDAANQKAVYHVSKSDWTISSSSDTIFYIYYDSSKPDNTDYGNTTGNSPATNVWDSDFLAVYHMNEDPGGTAPQLKDATSNGYDLTCHDMSSANLVDGMLNKAVEFATEYDYADNDSVSYTGDVVTVEQVLKPTQLQSDEEYYGRLDPGAVVCLHQGNLSLGRFRFFVRDPSDNTYILDTDNVFEQGVWVHAVGVYDGTYLRAYKNGSQVNSNNIGSISLKDITKIQFSVATVESAGAVVEELRYSKVARSAAWLKATYHSLFNTLLSWGNEEIGETQRLASVSSTLEAKDKGIFYQLKRLTSITSTIFSYIAFRELKRLCKAVFSIFSSLRRDRPKSLIKDIKREKVDFDIKNIP